MIAKMTGIQRVFEAATKQNSAQPILQRDRPWEDMAFGRYPSVAHDGTKFRMWYRAWFDGVAYAESQDGIHWQKPELGIYDVDQHLRDPQTGYVDPVKAREELFW